MSPLELLQSGRALIFDPAHWTQNASARTKSGFPTTYWSEHACSWCSTGAVGKLTDNPREKIATFQHLERAILELHPTIKITTDSIVVGFNDSHSHAEVLAVWERAIQNASRTGTPEDSASPWHGTTSDPPSPQTALMRRAGVSWVL